MLRILRKLLLFASTYSLRFILYLSGRENPTDETIIQNYCDALSYTARSIQPFYDPLIGKHYNSRMKCHYLKQPLVEKVEKVLNSRGPTTLKELRSLFMPKDGDKDCVICKERFDDTALLTQQSQTHKNALKLSLTTPVIPIVNVEDEIG